MEVFLVQKIKTKVLGKYFFDKNNIVVKDPEKLSSGFVQPKRKIINPIYFLWLK